MSQSTWTRLEHRVPALVARTIASYAAQSPRYDGVAPDQLNRVMTHSCREFTRLVIACGRRGSLPTDSEARSFRERARDRSAEGLAAADYIDGNLVLIGAIASEILDPGAPANELPAPREAMQTLMACTRRILREAIDAHQDESRLADSEATRAEGELLESLLNGTIDHDLAARHGFVIADEYGVLLLGLDPAANERTGDTRGRQLAGRRKARAATAALQGLLTGHVLSSVSPTEGVVLVPAATDPDAQLAEVRAGVASLESTIGAPVRGAFAVAHSADAIPSAVEECRGLLSFADPGDVAILDEHLFAFQAGRNGAGRERLHEIAATIQEEPGLWHALSTYFEADFNRLVTAQALHVHPNTVDNRLSKIEAVTGLDPRSARGVLLLGAVLAAADRHRRLLP